MAKIVRYNGNLQAFASAAPGTERTIFGDVAQANDLTSQINPDFLRGWGIVGPADQPALEDFNGAMYTHGQLLAYLHQAGVPEYNSAQEYHIGSITNSGGSLFVSRVNTNIGNTPLSSPTQWRNLDTAAPNVGLASNVSATIPSASVSVSFTATEIIAKTAIGGTSYALASLSGTLNISGTGVNGLDTGSAPANGYVAIYAIYNPTTGVSALLGRSVGSAVAADVYGGANMPAGYTASALLTVLATNGSGQFKVCAVRGRHVSIPQVQIFTTQSIQAAPGTSISLAAYVPGNAKRIDGNLTISSTVSSLLSTVIDSDQLQSGRVLCSGGVAANQPIGMSFSRFELQTPQTLFLITASSAGTPTFIGYATGYEI
jgi:hypothetical protein